MASTYTLYGSYFAFVVMTFVLLSGMFYIQEPRYNTFVRDITGQTHAYFNTGWHWKGFGNVIKVKKEMSVSFGSKTHASFDLPAKTAVFLDQVSSSVYATVRIVMPTSEKQFNEFISKFGTPENAIRTLMIPTIERTIDATSGLMTAEKYFSGGKTEFHNEFDKQMRNGLYVVDLKEVRVNNNGVVRHGSQDASKKGPQSIYGDNTRVVYKVIKRLNKNNVPILTQQEYTKYGISIASAIITRVEPNEDFKKRMSNKQAASAALAIAKENTKKEIAEKIYAITKGEREAAEAQAKELKIQVQQTTEAETKKSVAITRAKLLLETSKVQKETASIILARDTIKAKSIKVLADADAYAKRAVIKANGALELKLNAYKYAVDKMAKAIENRKVPSSLVIMGSNGTGTGSDLSGSSSSINELLQIIAAKSAKDLAIDLHVNK